MISAKHPKNELDFQDILFRTKNPTAQVSHHFCQIATNPTGRKKKNYALSKSYLSMKIDSSATMKITSITKNITKEKRHSHLSSQT